jgi:heat shock protein HtpX
VAASANALVPLWGIGDMAQTTGLYGFMQSQKTKTAMLFFVFMLSCQAYAFALILSFAIVFHDLPALGKLDVAWQIWRNSTIEIATTSLLWVFLAYVFQSRIIAQDVGSTSVTRREEPQAYNLLENLSIATGLKMPGLRVIETPSLNAFSSDLGFSGPEVTVTRGLLNATTKDELEAVMAHQVTRIRNGDSKLIGFAMIFMSMIFRMFEFFIRPFTSFNLRTIFFLVMLPFFPLLACTVFAIVVFVGLIAALATRFAISQKRIYLADAGTVDLIKDPKPLAYALLKMQAGESTLSQDSLINAMCIQAPEEGWLSSHPTTLSRVEAMAAYTGMAGIGNPEPSPRPAFQLLPTIRQLHSSGFGTSVSRILIMLPVVAALVGQSWVMGQYGGKIGLVKPLDDSAYVAPNPYRQTTTNSLNAGDVETQRHCFYNKTTGFITEGNAPVETYKTADSQLVSTAASASNPEFSTNRQFHIAGSSAIAAFGPMCAERGCDAGSFDMFARATFAYYTSAEAITTGFQQQSGAAGLAYAKEYLNSPDDQATRKFIKLATDNKVITEFQFNVTASRLLLNDFANYRACTVEDAKAVNPSLLGNETKPDAQATVAFSEEGTVDQQVKAITQMTKAEVHRQRMNFPLTLGAMLLAIWLAWKLITIPLGYLRRGRRNLKLQPTSVGHSSPATAMLLSPLAVILVLVSFVFPSLPGLIIKKLGGPVVQVVSSDQDITSHSSAQDQLERRDSVINALITNINNQLPADSPDRIKLPLDKNAPQLRTGLADDAKTIVAIAGNRAAQIAEYQKQIPDIYRVHNSKLPADSEFRIPMPEDDPPQPQIAVNDIAKMEKSQNCTFNRDSGFKVYGKEPLKEFEVTSYDIITMVQRRINDEDFYHSNEYQDFHRNLLEKSFLGQERRDHAYAIMAIERDIEKCIAGSCNEQETQMLNYSVSDYSLSSADIIGGMAVTSGDEGVRYAHQFLNSERDLNARKMLKKWMNLGKQNVPADSPNAQQILIDAPINGYRPCSTKDGEVFAATNKLSKN